jgi:phage terminase large subunit
MGKANVQKISPDIPYAFRDFMQPMRFKVAFGGRGSGKSIAFAMMLIWIAVVKPKPGCPPELILCAREFQNSMEDSVHKTICDLIESMGLSPFFIITKTSIKSIYGSEFIFKGLRMNVKSIKSIKGITRCFIEEAQDISAESWEVLIPTVRENGSEFWIAFNPDSADDPTYQNFVVNQRDNSIVRKINFVDNPFFPDTLREEMEHCRKFNPGRFDNIWLGEPKTISDAIIFGGKFRTEAFETPANVNRFYYGMDFGFSPDPAVLIRCFIKDRRLYIDHEAYKTKVELDDLPSFMLGVPGANVWPILADCSAPATISKLANNGFKISGVKKWPKSVEEGVTFLQNFDEIVIHDRCTNTAMEFRNYSQKVDRKTGQVLPEIVDRYNHAIDAIRYALQPLISAKGKVGAARIVGF